MDSDLKPPASPTPRPIMDVMPQTPQPQPMAAPPTPQPSPLFNPIPTALGPAPQPAQSPSPPSPSSPATSPSKPKKSRRRLLIIVIVLLVILILGAAGAGAWYKFHKSKPASSASNTVGGTVPDTQSPVNGKLVLTPTITPQATTKTQTVVGKQNQQLNMSDGFSFMVTRVADFTSSDQYNQPTAGNKFIAVTIVGGNRSNSGSIIFSDAFFQVRDATGDMLTSSIVDEQIPNNSFSTLTNLKTGQQQTGTAVYQVPSNTSKLTLVYQKQYQNSQNKSVFTVEGDVPLR